MPGHHCVAFVQELGWTEIGAIVTDTTEYIEAVEIDEKNLCWPELAAAPGTRT